MKEPAPKQGGLNTRPMNRSTENWSVGTGRLTARLPGWFRLFRYGWSGFFQSGDGRDRASRLLLVPLGTNPALSRVDHLDAVKPIGEVPELEPAADNPWVAVRNQRTTLPLGPYQQCVSCHDLVKLMDYADTRRLIPAGMPVSYP